MHEDASSSPVRVAVGLLVVLSHGGTSEDSRCGVVRNICSFCRCNFRFSMRVQHCSVKA